MAEIQPGNHTGIVTGFTYFRKVGHSMGLTVPKGVCGALDWLEGQALLIRAEGNRVYLESLFDHMSAENSADDQQINTRG